MVVAHAAAVACSVGKYIPCVCVGSAPTEPWLRAAMDCPVGGLNSRLITGSRFAKLRGTFRCEIRPD